MTKRIPITSEAQWHDIRRQHIGGSDIASLFNAFRKPDGTRGYRHLFQDVPQGWEFIGCVSPYCSGVRLWHEKKGNIEAEPFDNARTQAGRHFEPAIAAWAKERTGWDIRKVTDYLVHETITGMGASLDYEVLDHPAGHAAMDCKEVRWDVWKEGWLDAGEQPEPPLHIILQLHHQMAVGELPHGLAAVYASGQDLYLVETPRNESIIRMCEDAVAAFWPAFHAGKEPDICFDMSVAEDLYRQADQQIALNYSDKSEFQQLVDAWDFAKAQESRWKAGKEAAFYQILSEIQEAGEVLLPDGRVLLAPTRYRRGYTRSFEPSRHRHLTIKEN